MENLLALKKLFSLKFFFIKTITLQNVAFKKKINTKWKLMYENFPCILLKTMKMII
jgi:hypothetical protein